MSVPLSILDLAFVPEGTTPQKALQDSVTMAQRAEALGYRRIWYAEHHNMAAIASSATSVLIAHVAANTRTIRLGAGGIVLPNHSPLLIAEQFGTLECLHPGRIDLGLGRAPGTDQITTRALRVEPSAAEAFPSDVLELQAYLADETRVANVEATPGKGTRVPLYILGSSLLARRTRGAFRLALRLRVTLCAGCIAGCGASLQARVSAVRATANAARDRGPERDCRRLDSPMRKTSSSGCNGRE